MDGWMDEVVQICTGFYTGFHPITQFLQTMLGLWMALCVLYIHKHLRTHKGIFVPRAVISRGLRITTSGSFENCELC